MPAYKCRSCNKSFSEVEEALNHVNRHEKYEKGCVVPGCSYQKETRLSHHTRKQHRESCNYHCTSCISVFVRAADLSNHVRNGHCRVPKVQKVHRRVRASASGMSFYQSPSTFNLIHPTQPTSFVSYLAEISARINEERSSTATTNEATFNLDSATSDGELNRFIDKHLQPNQSFNQEMNQTVDDVCRFFQGKMKPGEIVKGGSMGKGTAVKEKSDIDLLMILPNNRVNSAKELEDKIQDIQDEIKRYLANKEHPGFTVMPETINQTNTAVRFTVRKVRKEIKVDLLPTFEVTDKRELYKQMKDCPENLLPYYKACLAKLQVDFVSPIPANVKNLIRLVKYWRKKYVSDGSPGNWTPNSYVMELVTIHLWERKGNPDHFNTLKAFHNVIETLANNQSIRVIWRDNYPESMIPAHTSSQRPLVMDPANPFNNVCLPTYSWDEIEKKAKDALKSRMLKDITSTDWS